MDRYAKDLSIFGVVWIVVVGILLYSFLSGKATPNPHQVGPT
jgi:hypothetical protein